MGLSHSLNGADASAAFANVVNGFILKQGGVRGVVSQFEKRGSALPSNRGPGRAKTIPSQAPNCSALWVL